jgi:hypothetical protein
MMTPDEIRRLAKMTRFLKDLRRIQETLREVNRLQRLKKLLRWIYENRAYLESLGPEGRLELRKALDEGEEWKKAGEKKTFPFYNQVLQTPFQSWSEYLTQEFGPPSEKTVYDEEAWDKILRSLLEE